MRSNHPTAFETCSQPSPGMLEKNSKFILNPVHIHQIFIVSRHNRPVGYFIGAATDMFISNLVGVIIGLLFGVFFGRIGSLMGMMDGGTGGMMGGMMGAMLGVMPQNLYDG